MAASKETTLTFDEWLGLQKEERDAVLERHERTRAELLDLARDVAYEQVKRAGYTTSPRVLRELESRLTAKELGDPRWLGALFRGKNTLFCRRGDWVNEGSHGRPVPVWVFKKGW